MFVSRFKKTSHQKPWDVVSVFGGWNYPEPIQLMGADCHPGQDPYLKKLVYMAEYGWHYCQKAVIEMEFIYPWTDYHPTISDEFRETFNARYKKDRLTLTIYERDGKLIMGNDWEAYWMYRERQADSAHCVLIGHFNATPGIGVMDRPFMISKPSELNFSK